MRRLCALFASAMAAALAVPAPSCSSDVGGGVCALPDGGTAGSFFVDGGNLDGFEPEGGSLGRGACVDLCYAADPLRARCCCANLYDCTESAAGVTCNASCGSSCPGGRRTFGFRFEPSSDWIRTLAQLEAGSVAAFARLRAELRVHRAPRSLLRSSSRARRDEIRHARTIRSLAHRDGACVPEPTVDSIAPRSLEELAIENVVEGCVRETYGALVAHWQATHAHDLEVRAAMKTIARDETRHAALAWKIHRWIEGRLDPNDRVRLDDARRRAVHALRAQIAIEPGFQSIRDLGLPTARQATALLDALNLA